MVYFERARKRARTHQKDARLLSKNGEVEGTHDGVYLHFLCFTRRIGKTMKKVTSKLEVFDLSKPEGMYRSACVCCLCRLGEAQEDCERHRE